MAMDVGGAKGGVKSDINVTPLVDVMLVLLIIMMIVAPMLQQGVMVTLPMAKHTEDKPDTQDQVVVFVDAQSKLYVNTLPVNEVDLVPRLQAALDKTSGSAKVVYLKGDVEAPYGAIMKMMDALRAAQIDTVGLITERPGGAMDTKGGK
jgi:biopolymer transport protein TolR